MSGHCSSTTYAIDWGLPCCQTRPETQGQVSLCARLTLFVIGLLAILAGILILTHIPGFANNEWGWSLISVGTLLALLATVLRCIKRPPRTLATNWDKIIVDPGQVATSWLSKLRETDIHPTYSRIYVYPLHSTRPAMFFTDEGLLCPYKEEISMAPDETKMLLIIWPQDEKMKESCRLNPAWITATEKAEIMKKLDVAFLYSSGTNCFGAINSELADIIEGKVT